MEVLSTFNGRINCQREKHPLRKRDIKMDENETKNFIFMDRFKFSKDDSKDLIFDTGFYTIECDKKTTSKRHDRFYHCAYRVFSLHHLLIGRLQLYGVLLTEKHSLQMSLLRGRSFDCFDLLNKKHLWGTLKDDFSVLDRAIRFNSTLEKAIIWYVLGDISVTHLERFMNYYRSLETLANEYMKEIDAKLENFVKSNLSMFDEKTKKGIRIRPADKVEVYLKNLNSENSLIAKILEFRHKIAHGEEFKYEFNSNLIKTALSMEDIISKILTRRIKEMHLIGLKNPNFLPAYTLFENTKTKEKIIIDMMEYTKKDDGYNRLTDILCYSESEIKEIAKEMGLCKEILDHILFYKRLNS